MQLFLSELINNSDKQFSFPKDESKHIVRVLRKDIGDILYITNGKGSLFKAQICLASNHNCVVDILENQVFTKHNYYIHIAIAPTKNNDRLEWFLEKATEIGVDEITPIICENSERKTIKKERLDKIVKSAMKQSLQYYLPKLNDAIPLKEFIKKTQKGNLYIAHCEELDKNELKKEVKPQQEQTILIGPEGDFSSTEIELALKNKYKPVSLGNTRLRTETAGIVACHTISILQ